MYLQPLKGSSQQMPAIWAASVCQQPLKCGAHNRLLLPLIIIPNIPHFAPIFLLVIASCLLCPSPLSGLVCSKNNDWTAFLRASSKSPLRPSDSWARKFKQRITGYQSPRRLEGEMVLGSSTQIQYLPTVTHTELISTTRQRTIANDLVKTKACSTHSPLWCDGLKCPKSPSVDLRLGSHYTYSWQFIKCDCLQVFFCRTRLWEFFFFFTRPHLWHMEVSGLRVESELKLLALHHSHISAESEPHLCPTPLLTVTPGS